MGKRKRSQNDSDEFERITGLKSWELTNEIEALALKNAFSNDEKITYLNLYLRFHNAKNEEYTKLGQRILETKAPGSKQWVKNELSKLKKFTKVAIFKIQTIIDEIME